MSIDSYNPPGIWQPFGAFSMAALQGAGRILHLKGQVSLDADGRLVADGDMAGQVEQALRNVEAVLACYGGRMQDVYTLTHHVTDIEDFMSTAAVRARFFKPPYPVTTTVEISRLYDPALLVEITASAEIPLARFEIPGSTGQG